MRNDRELRVFLLVRDAHGRPFDNATSLDVKWSSSNQKLARILHSHTPVYHNDDSGSTGMIPFLLSNCLPNGASQSFACLKLCPLVSYVNRPSCSQVNKPYAK